ncbi:N%2CN'-diacetylchitobiose-specific phosphotransferase enzyme IIA component [uncultured Clostridium sp.]|nr:N%2CN'-diacetylchitobiose-specific phosphotransferase enzyme IIA component [uncultured Clostridium sp.]
MDYETTAMELISYSGNARSMAFQALEKAKGGDFAEADRLLAESKKENTKAHNAQTDLLAAEASGQKVEMGILLVHAQDHLMTSMLAIELIQELIVLHRDKADREK